MLYFWDLVGHLKDVAAIITPFAIAGFGIWINNTIQTQNKRVERNSALTKQWADEFAKLSEEIYGTAVSFFMLYWHGKHEQLIIGEKEKFFKEMNEEIKRYGLRLVEQELHLEKYVALAPRTGLALNQAVEQLHQVINSWAESGGGDVAVFRERQVVFHQRARETHREILGLY